MSGLGLYLRYARVSVRAQLEYPGAFLLAFFAHFLGIAAAFLGIWARFDRFGALPGFSLAEVALFAGFISAVFAVTDTITRGFDVFGTAYVKTGDFDRLLLRPRSLALQLFGHEFRLSRFAHLFQAWLVLGLALSVLPVSWSLGKLALVLFAFAGGVALFSGIFILQATLSFWTVESLEAINALTYGGVEAAKYPLSLYQVWLRRFLSYFVPVAAVSYYPLLHVLGREDPLGAPGWLGLVSPLLGFAFFAGSLALFGLGVRRYTSVGS
jgi:ABC-2 type transport system permease protein